MMNLNVATIQAHGVRVDVVVKPHYIAIAVLVAFGREEAIERIKDDDCVFARLNRFKIPANSVEVLKPAT